MTEEEGASTHSTASKRELVFAWLDEHHEPGIAVHAVAKGAGVGFDTAKRWLGEWHRRPLTEDAPADDADDEESDDAEPEQAAAVDEDNVVVARAYLLTLEALRDQVLETQRLRRALEAR